MGFAEKATAELQEIMIGRDFLLEQAGSARGKNYKYRGKNEQKQG